MDLEAEGLHHLGSLDILVESTQLIATHRRLFSKISAVLILPLSLLFLTQIRISSLLLDTGISVAYKIFFCLGDVSLKSRLFTLLSPEGALFNAIYLLSVLAFAVLSTPAIVYAVTSISAANDLSFIFFFTTVVPKVWKRLIPIFLASFLHLILLSLAAALVLTSTNLLVGGRELAYVAVGVVPRFTYLICFMTISVVWHLAGVVSILEDASGAASAMRRSIDLIRGNTNTAVQILFLVSLGILVIEFVFKDLVVEGSVVWGLRVVLGLVVLALLTILILLGLVAQTVFYFVCKSYHRQRRIIKYAPPRHIGSYWGDFESIKDILFSPLSKTEHANVPSDRQPVTEKGEPIGGNH